VTRQLARIDLRTQTATIVNAGHPLPMRLRGGQVTTVDLQPDPPFGAFRDVDYRVQQLPLEPGDRLIFLTDGMTERNAATVDLEGLMVAGEGLHPREAVQHLVHALLEATDGTPEDDATVMCVDWRGGPPRDRLTDSGADD
jgi:serine phosphatase RsbU (regulator of sigma subunit)